MPELVSLHHSPGLTSDMHPWQDEAACLDAEDPNIFFPETGDVRTALEAAEWCSVCPVAKQCLRYAIDNDINDGIFGGINPRGREAYKPDRNPDRQTNRQKVITMTARQMTAKEISEALGISMRQVTRLRSKKVPA